MIEKREVTYNADGLTIVAHLARPDGSPTGGTTHVTATVPGVSYHPAHAARAWRAVLDLLDETIGTSSVTARVNRRRHLASPPRRGVPTDCSKELQRC